MKKPLLASIATATAAIMLAACSPQAAENTPTAKSVSYDTANPPSASEAADENSDNTATKDDEWSMDDAQDLTGSDITEAGVYRITGDAGDITVNAAEDAQVVLVLSDAAVGTVTVNGTDTAVTAGEAAEGGMGGGPAGGMGQRPDNSTASSNGLSSQA